MATGCGLGRFVAELDPIVYLPGGGSSWRGNIQSKLQGQEERRVLGRLFPECSAATEGNATSMSFFGEMIGCSFVIH